MRRLFICNYALLSFFAKKVAIRPIMPMPAQIKSTEPHPATSETAAKRRLAGAAAIYPVQSRTPFALEARPVLPRPGIYMLHSIAETRLIDISAKTMITTFAIGS